MPNEEEQKEPEEAHFGCDEEEDENEHAEGKGHIAMSDEDKHRVYVVKDQNLQCPKRHGPVTGGWLRCLTCGTTARWK